ncbi:MAG: hypothetical protein ACI351_02585 [Candidatus Avelusimicrobium sp.]|uniref:hypothetical protein n=1 Tax=Candidatus Avelusimicrobium sp. TaxID=3048833 RepID=UPI003F0B484A
MRVNTIFLFFRLACCVLFLCVSALSLRAQTVSPWFRGVPQTWKMLRETSFSAANAVKTPLLQPLSGRYTGYAVKTTVPNWLLHRLSHSNTFSAMEKEIFKKHPANTVAVTGKLSYFWDRDALLAASAGRGEINQKAFARHQELLQNTLAEVEAFAGSEIASAYNSTLFSPEEISRLMADPAQPPAFVVTAREAAEFAALSLEEQKAFTQNAWQKTTLLQTELLKTDPQKLSTQHFSDYYYLKLRRNYFSLLHRALEHAAAPRRTLIIRIRKRLTLDFLPENDMFLTDAQRLGKLYFYTDHAKSFGLTIENIVALQTETARQENLYIPYARAEAFEQPYEKALQRGSESDILFGEEEANRLRLLTSRQAADELPAKIAALQTAMDNARPNGAAADFYVYYFRLHAQQNYLQTRLAQAHFFLNHISYDK